METLTDCLMGEVLALAERCVTAFHGSDEASLFVEILRQNVLHQFVGVAALLRRGTPTHRCVGRARFRRRGIATNRDCLP